MLTMLEILMEEKRVDAALQPVKFTTDGGQPRVHVQIRYSKKRLVP